MTAATPTRRRILSLARRLRVSSDNYEELEMRLERLERENAELAEANANLRVERDAADRMAEAIVRAARERMVEGSC